ncbi:MAG: RNA degradosome polyphosphate kinase, partial [Planctomycetales bacterium]
MPDAKKRFEEQQTFSLEHFINRELSWLEFNHRVLEEAQDPSNPLLERVKFAAIVSSNLDEFFMVRLAGLREQVFGDGAPQDHAPDGMTSREQLIQVAQKTQELVAAQYRCWNEELTPRLAVEGIQFVRPDELTGEQQEGMDRFFRERVFPVITPMAIDPSHPSPWYHNRGLYLATVLDRHSDLGPEQLFAVVQVASVLPRLVPVDGDEHKFVFMEEAVAARLPELFGSCEVQCWTTFRVTRDSDLDILEQEGDDMLQLIEERLKARRRGDAVRLEISAGADEQVVRQIAEFEELHDDETYREVYRVPGPVDLTAMMSLVRLPGFDHLREKAFVPRTPAVFGKRTKRSIFDVLRKQDVLLHHPFDSFEPVVQFIHQAAEDPQVVAIKQTLYRTGGADSPIVQA